MRRSWLLAGLGLPIATPFFWWTAESAAQADAPSSLPATEAPTPCPAACGDESDPSPDAQTAPPLWQGPPLQTMPFPVRGIHVVDVSPVDAPSADTEPEPNTPEPEDVADEEKRSSDGGTGPATSPIPLVADDIVGGAGPAADRIDDDWRMRGADLGVPVDLGVNCQGQRVIGYLLGDATSGALPAPQGGPDMSADPTWANPVLYAHLDSSGNEVVDGFADEDDVPGYPAWSTRWLDDALQAAGADPEPAGAGGTTPPPPPPKPGRRGMPIDLIGRDAVPGTPGGGALTAVRSIGGKARGDDAASIVPTSALVVDDKLYIAYQVVNNWAVSGAWTTLQSQIVQFDLDPATRRIIPPIPELPAPALVLTNPSGQRPKRKHPPKTWRRGEPFQQIEFALVRPPDGSPPVVYIGGSQEGRVNDGLHLARCAPEDVMDPDRWEYYTARGWRRPVEQRGPLRTLPATSPLPSLAPDFLGPDDGIGEASLTQVGSYLVLAYTRGAGPPIAIRVASLDDPAKFGPELPVVTKEGAGTSLQDPRGAYGGFVSTAQSGDDTLVAIVSHWSYYGVYRMRITLNEPLE